MLRRTLQIGLTASLVVLGVVVAARAAEPAVRPVLYPAREVSDDVTRNVALPEATTATTTTVAPATTTTGPPATTTTTTVPPTTTTTEPPATTTSTTAAPAEDDVDAAAVLGAEYGWFERSDRVRELQRLLDLSADGVYGAATRAAHLAENEARGLATDGIPPVPTTTTTTTTTEPPVDEAAVLTTAYAFNQRGADVRVLQEVLGVGADGHYGPATRTAHLAENEARGLATDGVPPVPTTTTTVPPPTTAPPTTTTATPEEPPATTTTVPDGTPAETTTTTTTTAAPTTTAPSAFGGMGAEIVAQLLGQPCIADGDLSDCPAGVVELVSGLTG